MTSIHHNTGVMITTNNNKKRPLLQPPPKKFRITNCQWIDCVSNSSNNSTGTTTTTTTSNSNLSSQQRYQARNVCWNASGSLLAVGCSDSMIRFWNPMSISFDSSTTTTTATSCCKDVGSINTIQSATTTNSSNHHHHHHSPPIIATKFHPTSDPILCSMTAGSGTLRLWDVRCSSGSSSSASSSSNTSTSTTTNSSTIISSPSSSFTVMSSSSLSTALPIVVSVEWNPIQTHIISCTTHDGTVYIYDTRKFKNHTSTTPSTSNASTTNTSALVQKIQFLNHDRIESCIFDPMSGEYILAGVTNRKSSTTTTTTSSNYSMNGMGYIKVCSWKDTNNTTNNNMNQSEEGSNGGKMQQQQQQQQQQQRHEPDQKWYAYPAHAGPIYSIVSSHHRQPKNGGTTTTTTGSSFGSSPKLATGGSDAVVGIWDVSTMTCTSTISSRTKFIRSLAFSYPPSTRNDNDPQILAIATEEDVIELIDCASNIGSSTSIGCVNLSNPSSGIGRRSMMMSSSGSSAMTAGAEDICFHPTIPNLLACARTSDVITSSGMSSVTLLKFTISSS